MRKILFHEHFIRLIFHYVHSVEFQLLLSSSPLRFFFHTKVFARVITFPSFYSFSILKVFQALFKPKWIQAIGKGSEWDGKLRRLLIFCLADNSLLFIEALEPTMATLVSVFHQYEQLLRQQVNFQKSLLFFNRGVNLAQQLLLSAMLHISPAEGQYSRYPGLPCMISRSKTQVFSYLRDWVVKKVRGWKEDLLSHADHTVMIKVALQALTVYTISIFLLMQSLIHQITSQIRNFLWEARNDHDMS